MLRSLEQDRARYAWESITSLKAKKRRDEDERSGLLIKIIEVMKSQKKGKEVSEHDIKEYYDKLEERYGSYVKKTPTLIQTNGLGNTLAFYKSKFGSEKEEELSADKRAYKLLYDHINVWFKERFSIDKDILKWITAEDTSSIEVFKVTKEIIVLLNWMKRFAEAELKGEET